MQFIGQVALDGAPFGAAAGRVAYIFITDWADGTYDFDLGENAVIIQPRGTRLGVATRPLAAGPSLYRFGDRLPGRAWPERFPCEFAVAL